MWLWRPNYVLPRSYYAVIRVVSSKNKKKILKNTGKDVFINSEL